MNAKIALFRDKDFQGLADYNADDVEKVLTARKVDFQVISHADLEVLSGRDYDILVMPYVRGNFTDAALDSMVHFHADGCSLFFLGDLPHRGHWYPLRNMHSSLFHLSRYHDDFSIDFATSEGSGLTAKGTEIVGELEDPDYLRGKTFPGLRVTAFPPDLSHPLLQVEKNGYPLSSSGIVAIERRCRKFLGAKFVQIGFIGGEPPENVDGAFQHRWKYEPGLLTREWGGIDSLVWKMLEWLEPEVLAGRVDLEPVCREDQQAPVSILIKNLSNESLNIDSVCLFRDGQEIYSAGKLSLSSHRSHLIKNIPCTRGFGTHEYVLTATRVFTPATGKIFSDDDEIADTVAIKIINQNLGVFTERIYQPDVSPDFGFGFSVCQGFQDNCLTEDFRYFCKEIQRCGCQYVTVDLSWEDLEPNPGDYDWSIPDHLVEFATEEGTLLKFRLSPVARGSGFGGEGVPQWVLKEPAIDRHGRPGFFPTLWSPYFRDHYFNLISQFTKRYANAKPLVCFLIDFGNSDSPYSYNYWGGDKTIFDYSEFERQAFANYLKKELRWKLKDINQLFQAEFKSYDEIPVPRREQTGPFEVYLGFRYWSINQGKAMVRDILRKNAPGKIPDGIPKNSEIKILKTDSRRDAGIFWKYDEELFQSIRLNSHDFSLPNADLGIRPGEISMLGFLRMMLNGAVRQKPKLAILDWGSGGGETGTFAATSASLDIPVSLLDVNSQHDFSRYQLLVIPEDDFPSYGEPRNFILGPGDKKWCRKLRKSVEKGLKLLIFPRTCENVELTWLRSEFNLLDVKYGIRKKRKGDFPKSFGGGNMTGKAYEVLGKGEVLVADDKGETILLEKKIGKGAVLLAGYDTAPDSLDRRFNFQRNKRLEGHTLFRLSRHLGITETEVKSGNLPVWKELVHSNKRDYLLIFSHLAQVVENARIQVKLTKPSYQAFDLASGEQFHLDYVDDGWFEFNCDINPRVGRYFSFHDAEVLAPPD